jgi:hypothetical protein
MDQFLTFDANVWSEIVQDLESSRLDFINGARREIVEVSASLARLPIARPPLPTKPPDS